MDQSKIRLLRVRSESRFFFVFVNLKRDHGQHDDAASPSGTSAVNSCIFPTFGSIHEEDPGDAKGRDRDISSIGRQIPELTQILAQR